MAAVKTCKHTTSSTRLHPSLRDEPAATNDLTVVSFDFAVAQLPGWHTTIFPPYFVAGAIFSGLAMVVTLMVVCRVVFRLKRLVTRLHVDRMAKLMLLTGTMVAYAYGIEAFVAWYSGNPYEQYAFEALRPSDLELATLAGFGGVLIAALIQLMLEKSLIPAGDPRLSESLSFRNI